jgi:signal transduction histidine kinase/CheY-like chemotaxis protein
MGDTCEPFAPAGGPEEWSRWRAQTLTGLLWTTGIACGVLGVVATIQVRSVPFAIVSGCASSLMLASALARRAGFRLRAAVLLAGLFVATSTSLMLGGLSPNILFALGLCVVMATLLLGRVPGLALVFVAAITVAVVVPLRDAGMLPTDLRVSYQHPDVRTLSRVVIAFVLIASAMVVSVSYLLVRAEELFLQKARALETLAREQAQRRETDEQLRRAEAAFQKARELEILGRLSSSVAHDFNNALLIIQANADLALRRPSYAETALRAIGEATRQAAATTRQLRAFSPRAARPAQPISLAATLGQEVELLRRILPANITLRYARPEDDMVVLADDGQIQSLLTNLALNARDAMPEGGTLEMRLRAAAPDEANGGGWWVVIDVEDTGVGMSPETSRRLFEPFFTTKGAAGTGLGLASVKDVVERGGGRIEVTSELGRGTRFRIFWPRTGTADLRPSEDGIGPESGSGTVLVVDDDDAVRSAMAKSLSWRGYTVLEARTGADALLVARRHHEPIDVLCVDLVLPGMPARQVVDGTRAAHPEVRVLACSGYVPDEAGAALEVADEFLSKPFSPNVLAASVHDLVERARRGASGEGGDPSQAPAAR